MINQPTIFSIAAIADIKILAQVPAATCYWAWRMPAR
jgi:hypothetical protein